VIVRYCTITLCNNSSASTLWPATGVPIFFKPGGRAFQLFSKGFRGKVWDAVAYRFESGLPCLLNLTVKPPFFPVCYIQPFFTVKGDPRAHTFLHVFV
jgi:hypothetical protein